MLELTKRCATLLLILAMQNLYGQIEDSSAQRMQTSLNFQSIPDPSQAETESKKRTIDSLISIGENMFLATQTVLFKSSPSVEGDSRLINEQDLLIVLGKHDQLFYQVEWDNRTGYIFQFDIEPYNILSEKYLSNKEVVLVDQNQHSALSNSEEPGSSNPNPEEKLKDRCEIQFFASKYTNKVFPQLNDLGKIISSTFPHERITRYRVIANQQMGSCEEIIQELDNRGFPGSFVIN